MSTRAPSQPPELPGFDFVELIGFGGYADVFLYDQHMPSRRVAVKVLDLDSITDGGVSDYTAEANLMAKVSAHPYIVQVFQAAVAPDRRPYLVMEYYPGDNFYQRARSEQMSVAEALRVGVQLASAVETAHRAGVLHRDIKPANVLTSEYRRPGLTDFGIASVQAAADATEGLSIPWSPPEAFGNHRPVERTDVYSLAATVYDLLAGRSPFEIRGGDNRPLALMGRIERDPVPAIARADVPPMLERVLADAMAKNPEHRPATAAEFGRQLQAVESELQLAVTLLELADDHSSTRVRRDDDVDEDATRVKSVTEVTAQGPTPAISSVPAAPTGTAVASAAPATPRAREGMLGEPDVDATVHRAPAPPADPEPVAPPRRVPKVLIGLAAIAVLFVAVIAITATMGGGDGGDAADDSPSFDEVVVDDDVGAPVAVTPAALSEVIGVDNGDGSFTFQWDDVGSGATYAVTEDGAFRTEQVDDAEYTGFTACVDVEVIAASGLISAPTRGCAE